MNFTVQPDGTINNINFENSISAKFDSTFTVVLNSMSGKWRPAKKDSVRQSEDITMWISFYNGPYIKKNYFECLKKSRELMAKEKYDKAMEFIDIALMYNQFSHNAIKLKVNCLAKLNKQEEICAFLNENKTYHSEKINKLSDVHCK